MIQKEIQVKNKSGLHARPASALVDVAKRFVSSITLSIHGKTKNAKSIIGVLSLGVKQNCVVTLTLDGPDEQEAFSALQELIGSNFYEENEDD